MVAVAVDFKKAYDSIRREMLIGILMELKVDDSIIDFVKRVYRCDNTMVKLDGGEVLNFKITSGIRH